MHGHTGMHTGTHTHSQIHKGMHTHMHTARQPPMHTHTNTPPVKLHVYVHMHALVDSNAPPHHIHTYTHTDHTHTTRQYLTDPLIRPPGPQVQCVARTHVVTSSLPPSQSQSLLAGSITGYQSVSLAILPEGQPAQGEQDAQKPPQAWQQLCR